MPSEEAPLAGVSWSSSLSVAEAAAIREAGFQARGLVMGSSVYHLGVSYSPSDYARMTVGPWGGNFGGAGIGGGPWGGGGYQGPGGFTGRGFGGGWNGPGGGGGWRPATFPGWCKYYSADDLGWGAGWTGLSVPSLGLGYAPAAVCWERTVFEDGLEEAASLALQRIEAETSALGAHGVIGTRLNFHYLPEMTGTVEFTAIGTAVVRPTAPPLVRPFTSHLNGQDLLKLIQAGLVPVGVGVGAGSVVAQLAAWTGGGTYEIAPFGEAIEHSRRLAAERLVHVAGRGGQLVLGTMASSGTEMEEGGRVTTTVLIGTVVRRFAEGHWATMPLPVMRLSKP